MHEEDRRLAGCPSVPLVLSISEILICIFRELDNASCAAVARVCQTWVEAALDVVWEHLKTLLGPVRGDGRELDWETGSPNGDWARFASYTKRVRSFSYDGDLYGQTGHHNPLPNVLPKLLIYVANNQGASLLPQNQRLWWRARTDYDLQIILPFLSSTLRELDIEIRWNVSTSEIEQLLHTLDAVLPHDMVSLRFFPNRKKGRLNALLVSIVNTRSNLQVLRIPSTLMTTAMVLPNLRVLEAESDWPCNSDPGTFLLHLSDKCPLIEDLRVIFRSDSMLTGESIRPLFRCSKLRILDLEDIGAVDLQNQHITEMGSAWRGLEAFHISSRWEHVGPLDRPSGTPIGSLVTFAQAFSPKLRKLAILVNSFDVPPPPDPPVRFPNLEFFSVGTSQLGQSEAEYRRVARFLGAVLPLQISSINSDDSFYDPSRSVFKFEPLEDGRRSESPGWDIVSEMLYDYRKASPNDA